MITILETLQIAEYNLRSRHPLSAEIARDQLHNAIALLEKGYSLYDSVDLLLEKFKNVESVPEKPEKM